MTQQPNDGIKRELAESILHRYRESVQYVKAALQTPLETDDPVDVWPASKDRQWNDPVSDRVIEREDRHERASQNPMFRTLFTEVMMVNQWVQSLTWIQRRLVHLRFFQNRTWPEVTRWMQAWVQERGANESSHIPQTESAVMREVETIVTSFITFLDQTKREAQSDDPTAD